MNRSKSTESMIKTAWIGILCNFLSIGSMFVYRKLVLKMLPVQYVGIDGLFKNLFRVLSILDIGASTTAVYFLYQPIQQNDIEKIRKLLAFFRRIFRLIGIVILLVGLVVIPFLKYMIKDLSEVPPDVDFRLVYLILLLNLSLSYFFSYRFLFSDADQRQYILILTETIGILVEYTLGLSVLYMTGNYVLMVAAGNVAKIVIRALFSRYVLQNSLIFFEKAEELDVQEKKRILYKMAGNLPHNIGSAVAGNTDQIILTRVVGLSASGFYSNYAVVFSGMITLMEKVFGGVSSSVGNKIASLSKKEVYEQFKKLQFLNGWIIGVTSICIYVLIEWFIELWIGEQYLLSSLVRIVVTANYFLSGMRITNVRYVGSAGLFDKDRLRPLIEIVINLVTSVLLAKRYGISGVFMGTIISQLCTAAWREPYILHRYYFKRKMSDYIYRCFAFTIVTISGCIMFESLMAKIVYFDGNWIGWIIKAIIVLLMANLLMCVIFCRTEEFKYFKAYLTDRIKSYFKID